MSKRKENRETVVDFNVKLHRIGRIWTTIGILLILSVPVIVALYYKAEPDWAVFGSSAVISVAILNILAGIGEPIIYAPMLGTNGEYLAFITGNLSNLKIPCVVKAQEIAGTKLGTEEHELVSTIAIAVSSLVTILIIAVFVIPLAVSPLVETIQNSTFIKPAFGCVVYALFGSLGGKYIVKHPKLAVIPIIVVAALSAVLAVSGMKLGSTTLFVGIAVCIVFAAIQFVQETKKLRRKEELQRLEAIAAGMSYEKIVAIEKAQRADELGIAAEEAAAEGGTSEEIAEQCLEEAVESLEKEEKDGE